VTKIIDVPDDPTFTDNTGRSGDAIKHGLDSPPEPETNGQDDKLEARRDGAEELKLEARRDGVIDVELEARIEKLESAGDIVEETKAPRQEGSLCRRRLRHTREREDHPGANGEGVVFEACGGATRRDREGLRHLSSERQLHVLEVGGQAMDGEG
jgi:hypothetical protein